MNSSSAIIYLFWNKLSSIRFEYYRPYGRVFFESAGRARLLLLNWCSFWIHYHWEFALKFIIFKILSQNSEFIAIKHCFPVYHIEVLRFLVSMLISATESVYKLFGGGGGFLTIHPQRLDKVKKITSTDKVILLVCYLWKNVTYPLCFQLCNSRQF